MGSLFATVEDVERWEREGRTDILRFERMGDLWIDEKGDERERCPFVRKNPGSKRHRCTIYDTRPQVCRDYEPWASYSICETV
jgi:Fe-S-cluster containining protein